MTLRTKAEPHYLGDGLYAGFDGYQVKLWTDRAGTLHEVYLDQYTLAAFLDYVRWLHGPDAASAPEL